MTDLPPPGFQPGLEAIEGYQSAYDIPKPINPLQAQTAFERRVRIEDWVAHVIAVIQTSGFFMLAFAALLGFVDLKNAAVATFLGTVMGYAVGKVDPIFSRYFLHVRHTRPVESPTTAQQEAAPQPSQTPPRVSNA